MQRKYLIGVDLGTSSTKAALYQTDGRLVSEASAEVPLLYPKPGVVEQENEDFYSSAAQTVRQCIESSGDRPERDRGHRLRFANGGGWTGRRRAPARRPVRLVAGHALPALHRVDG